MALALACNALAQSTYVFNPHYAVIPGDPEPRTFLWSDARNWGGGLPGSTDTVVVNEYSELTGSFTVGSARIVDQMVAGAGGSLEVLNNFRADGVVTLFNQLTLRGQSQFGLTDTTGTLVSFYGDVDNYGDAVVYSTHGTAFSMVGGVGSQPVVTNHTGASFLFGATQIGGAYSGFVNQAGATLTKTGSGNATLVASLSQPDGSFRRAFDHHGQLNVQGGKLTLDASAGDWDGGGVTLSNKATLDLNFSLPSGEVAVNGTGSITGLGGDMAGDLTLDFAADSAVVIDGFHPYDINHDLTLDGPVTLRNSYFTGADGRLILRGATSFALPAADGVDIGSYIYLNVRNEGAATVTGGGAGAGISGSNSYTWSNIADSTLDLTGHAILYGSMVLDNAAGATLRYRGAGAATNGRIEWTSDHRGLLDIAGGQLEVQNARHWDGGTVALSDGGRLAWRVTLPDGTTTFTGTGSVGTLGSVGTHADTFADTTLQFAAGSQITLSGFDAATAHTLTLDGPMKFTDGALRGTGTVVFRGAGAVLGGPSHELTDPGIHLDVNTRNESADLRLENILVTGVGGKTFTNDPVGPSNPALVLAGDVFLEGEMLLDNAAAPAGQFNTIRKIGSGTASVDWTFSNFSHLAVDGGQMIVNTPGNWEGGTATIAAGSALYFPNTSPLGTFELFGQGTVQLADYTLPVDPDSYGDVRLPFADGARLTVFGSTLRVTAGAWVISTPQTFVQTQILADLSVNMVADTTWNRAGVNQGSTIQGQFYNGLASGGPDVTSTIHGQGLVSGAGSRWVNYSNSTVRLTQQGGLRGAGAEFLNYGLLWRDGTVGSGVAPVDWTFVNQGTVRIEPNTGLDFTAAGDWDGGALEINGGFVRFANTAPSGTVDVFSGGGDFIFHNAHVGEAGLTLNFADTDSLYRRAIFSDFSGPGRVVLSGRDVYLQRDDTSDNFIRSAGETGTDTPNYGDFVWANTGGVELRGDIVFAPSINLPLSARELDLRTSIDVVGRFRMDGATIRSTRSDITVKNGGRLVVDSSAILHYYGSAKPGRLIVETGGVLETAARNITNNTTSDVHIPLDLHGTLAMGAHHRLVVFNYDSETDWSGGRVELDPSGTAEIDFFQTKSAPLGEPTFSGPGQINFGGFESAVDVTNRIYVFDLYPTVSLAGVSLTGPDAYLRLVGKAHLAPEINVFSLGSDRDDQRLELMGEFTLKPEYSSGRTLIGGLSQVNNFGDVVVKGIETTGTSWRNETGSTFQIGTMAYRLTANTDLLLHTPVGPVPAFNSNFYNEAGADFRVVGPTRVNWYFHNFGRVQVVGPGTHLTFANVFRNFSGGELEMEADTRITFDGFAPSGVSTAGTPLFRGGGNVYFKGAEAAAPMMMDGTVLAFGANASGRPFVTGQHLGFASANTTLRLEGSAVLDFGLFNVAPALGGGNTLELAGDFDMTLGPGGNMFPLSVPAVQNSGRVATNPNGATTYHTLATSVSGLLWHNQTGGNFVLNHGVDLAHSVPSGGTVPVFLNDTGATFTVTGGVYGASNIAWDFTNRGLIDVQGGGLVFQGVFTNEAGGDFRVGGGGSIDFGSNAVITLANFGTGDGTIRAGQVNIDANLVNTGGPDSQVRIVTSGLTIGDTQVSGSGDLGDLEVVIGHGGISGAPFGVVSMQIRSRASITTSDSRTYIAEGLSFIPADPLRIPTLSVDAGVTLILGGSVRGTGTITATELEFTGAIVGPGNSPGTLELVGDTTFANDTIFEFELGAGAQDLITVDGDLVLDGTVDITSLFDLETGSYTLFTYTGTLTDNELLLGTLGEGIESATLFTDLTNRRIGVNLIFVAVPEPASYASFLGLAALGAVALRRRR